MMINQYTVDWHSGQLLICLTAVKQLPMFKVCTSVHRGQARFDVTCNFNVTINLYYCYIEINVKMGLAPVLQSNSSTVGCYPCQR